MSQPASQKTIQKKVVVAACFGTFLEWYDFLTFASLAVYFSVLFFPADDPVAALLASLGTFGVGMIVRPLGAQPIRCRPRRRDRRGGRDRSRRRLRADPEGRVLRVHAGAALG